ncbi:MAG: hypothetical protein K0S09_2039 [Sphingobacteriaceae bacterium]|jgi:hypothetical protein|nr:hypothetical protein [Sphingobacteriaceae bacterium]
MKPFEPIVFLLTAVIISCSNSSQKSNSKSLKIDSLKKVEMKGFTEPENSDCVFDTSTYKFTTQALRKYKADIKFSWDDIEKEAKAVLENGDTLSLHIGGCDHFSYSATLVTDIPFTETAALTEKSRWLAKTFFGNGFDSKYDSCISKGLFKEVEIAEEQNIKAYQIIDRDSAMTNMVYEGFQFLQVKDKTKIVIGGYLN